MKKLTLLLSFGILLFASSLCAQSTRYPANVSPVLKTPYSLFLSDYTDPAKDQLAATVVFNDYNESEWTFKLKLTLEGYDIKLETVDDFQPSQPITVSPGEPVTFTGSDWTEYFDFRNLNVTGPASNELYNSGRLPEGGYTLYLEVLDYETGEVLSRETSVTWWMELANPPLLILPADEGYINPASTQISFTWQLFSTSSLNDVLGTEYQLTIWEITDNTVSMNDINPLSAVQNGQTLQIFQSDIVTATSYIYGPADPALEKGKAYIYQIQAFDPDGKDSFKNSGKSEFRRFYYGWPQGGTITLKSPADGYSMSLLDQAAVIWTAPDNLVTGEQIIYELKIAEMESGEDSAQAIAGDLWYYEQTDAIGSDWDKTRELPYVTPTAQYAWQVTGYADGQEVAVSPIQTFFGPPLMEDFYAGVHRVKVYSVTSDPTDISGTGAVRLSPNVWTDISFEHLTLEETGLVWTLTEGEIFIDQNTTIELTPRDEINDVANFMATQYRLNSDGLYIYGNYQWPLHLASVSEELAVVKSQTEWFAFNEYEVTGGTEMAEDDTNTFELLDPYGFTLEISPSSMIWSNNGDYWMELNGFVALPEIVQDVTGNRVEVPFHGKEQLYYFNSDAVSVLAPHHIATSVDIYLESTDLTIDFSEIESPGDFSSDLAWKGIAYHSGNLIFPTDFDPLGRLTFGEEITKEIGVTGQSGNIGYVAAGGVFFNQTLIFNGDEPLYFNTFPAQLDTLVLDIQSSDITDESSLTGNAMIPVLSTADPFYFYVPMNSNGFLSGYFKRLEGYSFTHNPDVEDQVIYGVVQRAVFEEDERLSLTLDLSWPALGIEMTGVSYFKAWGNYNIGFYTPEGIYALDEQLTTTYKDYPITIDGIGAGRSSGLYGFGVTGKVALGDDVSGDTGAPSFNMYSLVENELLPGDYVPDTDTSDGTTLDMDAETATIEDAIAEEKINLLETLSSAVSDASSEVDASLAAVTDSLGNADYTTDDLIVTTDLIDDSTDWSSAGIIALVPDMLAQISVLLPEDSYAYIFSRILVELDSQQQAGIFPSFPEIPKTVASRYGDSLAVRTLGTLSDQVDAITKGVTSKVGTIVTTVTSEIDVVIGTIIDNAAAPVVTALSDLSPDAGTIVAAVAADVKKEILAEVHASINRSVAENVTNPIATLLQDQVMGRAQDYIKTTAEAVILAMLTPGKDPVKVLEEQLAQLDDVLGDIANDVLAFMNPANITSKIRGLGTDAMGGISGERILGRIEDDAKKVIANYVADKITDAAEELANQVLSDNLGVEIPLDLGKAIGKLMNGGSIRDVLADPITVKVRSKIADFNGTIYMTEDHPVYGDAFSGAIDVLVKVPDESNPIYIQAAYMNGRKDGQAYWFVEVGAGAKTVERKKKENFAAPEGSENVGAAMNEETQPPSEGIYLGIAEIMAVKARIYKHMSADDSHNLVPDSTNQFGAYLHLIMFGPSHGDLMRLEVEGEVNTFTDGNLILDFSGNLQLDNQNPQINEIDVTATVQGTLDIQYNKNEKHFIGYATVKIISDGLCAAGSLLVDVKPGAWHVSLGSRDFPIVVVPGCVGIAYYGWIDLNSDYVEVGAGLGLAFYKDFSFDIKVAEVGLTLDANVHVNAFASVNYHPLSVREIGVFVEMWADIAAWYKIPLSSKKSINLVSIYFYASSTLRFNPEPKIMYGTLKGRVELVSVIKFNFSKDYELNI